MKSTKILFTAVILSFLFISMLHAEGVRNFDLSARAAALGGAFTARADDASALYYNPAAMVFLEGVRIKTNILVNKMAWSASDPATGLTHKSLPFQLQGSFYLTWRVTKWLGLGVGGFNPYQAASDWPWSWPGVRVCVKDSLSAYYIRPAVAVRLTKFLSIGAGLDFVMPRLRLNYVQRYGLFGIPEYKGSYWENRCKLKGSGKGYVLSMLLNFSDKLRIGARFHQKVVSDLSGEIWMLYWRNPINFTKASARFHKEGSPGNPITPTQNMPATSRFTTPSELAAGLMWKPLDKLLLHFEAERIGWKDVGDIEIEVNDPSFFLDPNDPASYGTIYHPENKFIATLKHRDTLNLRAGIEYRFNPTLALRAGFASMQGSAADDMVTPVSLSLDRSVISLGFGYEGPLFSIWSNEKISELSFDIFVRYVMGQAQTSAFPGLGLEFDSDYLVIGLGIGLNIL